MSMILSRQECWRGLPFPPPGNLPDPGTEPRSPGFQADSLPSDSPGNIESFAKPDCSRFEYTAWAFQCHTVLTCFALIGIHCHPTSSQFPATSISAYVLNCYLCFQTLLKNPFFMRIFQIPSIIFKNVFLHYSL